VSTKYGDPAFEWEEANAVNADGQAVIDAEREAERLHLAQVADATRVWAMALGDARTAVMKAQRLHQQLDNLDFDFGESPLGRVARLTLNEAWRGIDSVMTIADGLLKPVVDAELARLRAEVDQLQRRLADRDRLPVPASHYCDSGNCGVSGDGTGDAAASAESPSEVLRRAVAKMRSDIDRCGDLAGSFVPAVADWLDSEARHSDGGVDGIECVPNLPFAVALAYLGVDEPPGMEASGG
jgi:hypothetical protein